MLAEITTRAYIQHVSTCFKTLRETVREFIKHLIHLMRGLMMFWNGLINSLLGFSLAIFAVIAVVVQAPIPPLAMLLMPVLALGLCITGMVMMTISNPTD